MRELESGERLERGQVRRAGGGRRILEMTLKAIIATRSSWLPGVFAAAAIAA